MLKIKGEVWFVWFAIINLVYKKAKQKANKQKTETKQTTKTKTKTKPKVQMIWESWSFCLSVKLKHHLDNDSLVKVCFKPLLRNLIIFFAEFYFAIQREMLHVVFEYDF